MKRKLTLCFIILIVFGCFAFCAGKLSVTQENFHVISSYGTYGYSYAKVKNIGDKPIKVNAGVLEIFDSNGDPITSTDWMYSYASILQPGEYTYVQLSSQIEDKTKTASDYSLTITGKSDNSSKIKRLPCTTELELKVTTGWWTYNYMYAYVTNDTSEPLFGIEIVFALLDAEGNILYVTSDDLYSNRALAPGSTMIFRADISSAFMEYFKTKGFEPLRVDAIAYAQE